MYNVRKNENKDIFIGVIMFKYEIENLEFLSIKRESVQFDIFMQESLSCINMGLKISEQYMIQAIKISDKEIEKNLLRLSAEELSNIEMISHIIKMLFGDIDVENLQLSNDIVATGDSGLDLLSNISLVERSKVLYEGLYNRVDDVKLKEMIMKIVERENEHSLYLRETFNKIQRGKIKDEIKNKKQARLYFSTIKPVIKENSYDEFKKTAPAVLGGGNKYNNL